MSQVNATFAIAKPRPPAVERKCCVERRFPLGMPHVSANMHVHTPWGCGECRFCRRSEEMICPGAREAGIFQDGGYAEYVRVPARRYLYPIGDLDPVEAAPLGCGGLTPYRAVKHARAWLGPGSRALVLGAGGLGQFGIQYLRLLTGATVHAGDPSAQKRERALELGAEEASAPEEL